LAVIGAFPWTGGLRARPSKHQEKPYRPAKSKKIDGTAELKNARA
jgi:hypothetical protein